MLDNWGVDDEDEGMGLEGNELELKSDEVELLVRRHEDS